MWGEVQMFKVISLQTGETREAELIDLSRNLMLNSIVARGTPDGGLEHLGLITHQDLVFYAYTWALEASKTKPPEAVETLRLVGLWLEDSKRVSSVELKAAAEAARAARAAGDAGAAEAAAWAAAWAARASWAARAAAEAAAEAAGAAEADTYQKQALFILEHLQKTSQTSFPFRRA
jgi:hypothetical protein